MTRIDKNWYGDGENVVEFHPPTMTRTVMKATAIVDGQTVEVTIDPLSPLRDVSAATAQAIVMYVRGSR